MKNFTCRHFLRTAPARLLVPALLGLGMLLLPRQSIGQATNSCNLIPNPSFEQQNVAQLSGEADNVSSTAARYNEVTSWKYSDSFGAGTGSGALKRPTYFATNAPTGSISNPFTNNPALDPPGPDYKDYLGVSFIPYNYNQALHNGAISILTASNGGASGFLFPQDYISPSLPLNITATGAYYASFRAYHAGGGATKLGMRLISSNNTSTIKESAVVLQNSAWTRVSGQINITSTGSHTVIIGNFNQSDPQTTARYHIDEVELYKIPTAGPPVSCSGSSVIIGEGCPIPDATYEWRVSGQSNPIATTLSTSVNITGTYTLKVTLPDNTTFSSTVSVTGCNPPPTLNNIIGPNVFCPNSNGTFTINPTQSVTWTASPAGYFTVSSGSGSTFTTSAVSGVSGQGYITATFNNLTGSPSITKAVSIYAAPPVPTVSLTQQDGCFYVLRYHVDNYDPAFTYTVNKLSAFTLYEGSGPTTLASADFLVKASPRTPGVTFTITATSSCSSSSSTSEVYGDPFLCDNNPTSAYPNPATESLTLSEGTQEATLRNSQGRIVAQPDATGKFDVRGLPAGLYYLRARQKGQLVNQYIEVKH